VKGNKSLLEYKGKPLIQHAVDVLGQVCDKVVISSNQNEYDFTGGEVWPDKMTIRAPIVGIYSCLKQSTSENNIVLSCDMPLINQLLLEYLISGHHDNHVVIPVHDGDRIEPLCGIYTKKVVPLLGRFITLQDFSLQHFIKEAKCRLMVIDSHLEFYRDNMFTNINTMEDFKLLPGIDDLR